MALTPKENYLKMLSLEVPEYIPSFYEPYSAPIKEELLTPQSAPDGPIVTALGVEYVGSPENMFGAMPAPGKIIIDDISKWPEQLKIRDVSDRDWEGYYKKMLEGVDRSQFAVAVDSGDYFLTLVSLMGFTGALTAMFEETDAVVALLEHISKFYTMVLKKQFHYLKPDVYFLMDDDAAYRAPFFSLDMYRKIFKPFHKLHADIALENGAKIDRHDCGKSEQFIDDWLELGITSWNPVQTSNDCVAIKKKYVGRLCLEGCWDPSIEYETDQDLKDALAKYVDTFAPGGGFGFMAMANGRMDDPEVQRKGEIIKDFYFDYAKDWYKRH
ncbi:MAG: hypothetical protein LBC69_02300 [Eubacteriaceae bacterium]|jgi:hypothetical protein|nr:hypothetical protein [Eubacteriaceae bacterium]